MRKLLLICILLMCVAGEMLVAQNNTNSPYTRYGFGRLEDPAFGRCFGMGGLSIGMRGNTNVNPANPASYSAVDSMTFIFDMGVSGSLSHFKDGASQRTTGTGNLDYLAIQFSATKWMGISLGLMPYSSVGYDFGSTDSIAMNSDYYRYNRSYKGTGGISQVYLGLSFNLWKRLSIGANAYFLWGEMMHNKTLSFESPSLYSSNFTSNLHVYSFNFRYGLQYTERIAKKHLLTLGFAYENRSRLHGTYEETLIDVDTTMVSTSVPLQFPSFYGAGISYTYDDRLTIGVDYSLYEFSKAKTFNVNKIDSLNNRHKCVLGAEYIHNPNGMRYVDRVRWRIGAELTTPYVSDVLNYGLTVGVGFPLKTAKTILNVAFKYDKIGSSAKGGIREDCFKLSFSATINETWFFKSKIK